MSRRSKNSDDANRFLKYSGKRMSRKEMNVFERRLQKDAFDSEAAEGFSMVPSRKAEKDLLEIRRRLEHKQQRKLSVVLLRVAAVVTLLAATTVILTLFRNDNKKTLVSEAIIPEPEKQTIAIPASEGIQKQAEEVKRTRVKSPEKYPDTFRYIAPANVIDTIPVAGLVARAEVAEIDTDIAEPEDVKHLEGKMAGVSVQIRGVSSVSDKGKITGKVISAEDNLPIPGVSIVVKGTTRGTVSDVNGSFSIDMGNDSSLKLVANFIGMESKEIVANTDSDMLIALNTDQMALDEVVVVGYGVSKDYAEDNLDEHIAPKPSTGYQQFRNYIEEHLSYPQDITVRTKEVVILSIMVRSNGITDNITVLKSPGQSFSDEAIRLIKEGPSWIPATLNGLPQDEEVRVRIIFR